MKKNVAGLMKLIVHTWLVGDTIVGERGIFYY